VPERPKENPNPYRVDSLLHDDSTQPTAITHINSGEKNPDNRRKATRPKNKPLDMRGKR